MSCLLLESTIVTTTYAELCSEADLEGSQDHWEARLAAYRTNTRLWYMKLKQGLVLCFTRSSGHRALRTSAIAKDIQCGIRTTCLFERGMSYSPFFLSPALAIPQPPGLLRNNCQIIRSSSGHTTWWCDVYVHTSWDNDHNGASYIHHFTWVPFFLFFFWWGEHIRSTVLAHFKYYQELPRIIKRHHRAGH